MAKTVTRILAIFSLIVVLGSALISVSTTSATSATTRIFEDDFETGDFSKWTVVENNPTVTSGEAHSGDKKAVLDDTAEYAQAQFLDVQLVDYAIMRAYVMFKGFPDPEGESTHTTVLGLHNFTSTGERNIYLADVYIVNDAGTVKWALRYYDNGHEHEVISELEKPVLNTWYLVEVECKANSTRSGVAKIFIDGNELTDVSQTGKNNNVQINGGYIWTWNTAARWYDDVAIDIIPTIVTKEVFLPLVFQVK